MTEEVHQKMIPAASERGKLFDPYQGDIMENYEMNEYFMIKKYEESSICINIYI